MIKTRKIILYFIFYISIITSTGCQFSHDTGLKSTEVRNDYKPILKRLANNMSGDWGIEAIHLPDTPLLDEYKPIVAIIDSGNNLSNKNILAGYNLIDNTTDVTDVIGHGTEITTLLLKVAPQSLILPVKVFDKNREQDPAIVARAIEWAIDNSAQVINLSLAVPNESIELKQAILKAINKNIPVIASVGNDGLNKLPSPANMEPVISVIARDINNVDVAFSNYSSIKKSVSAPGVHIKVGNNNFVSGTSFATAFVSGTVTLIKS